MMRLLACGLMVAVLGSVAPRPGAAQNPDVVATPEGVSLNFQGVDLGYAMAALAESAGISIAASNLPTATVTLRTAEPVPVENLRSLMEQLAAAHGITITEVGGFLQLQGPIGGEVPGPPRNLYVYRLQHARAPFLAATLQALFGGGGGGGAPPVWTTSARPLSQQLSEIQQQSESAALGAVRPDGPVQVSSGGGDLEGDVQIVPEETTNTLLVRATEGDWLLIEQAIQALDLRPLQVVIEVIIAEVRHTDNTSVGLAFAVQGDDATVELPGVLGVDDFAAALGVSSDNVDISATLAALASTGNVRILSRPVVQAQNNQEARILVGDERPFVQVSRTLPTDQAVQDEIIQYRDVGTVLTILPTINENGYVNLLLTQEVSSATSEREFGAPVISTREAQTQLLARHGQTVVIGGLVDQQTEETRSGIPLLKDIPLLGYLFGSTSERITNSELFLFLTPYVVMSDEDADELRSTIEGSIELIDLPIRSILPPSLRSLIPDTVARLPGGGVSRR